MKKIIIYLFTLVVLLGAGSCNNDNLSSESLFVDPAEPRTAFDKWLLNNYTYPYNIDFKYKMVDNESDMSYQLAPADVNKSLALAKLIKYLWLEAYDECVGVDFLRTYVPRVIHLIGSGAYNANNTVRLGTAEGGMKITLYDVNGLDVDNLTISDLNDRYLRTMHHEFGHILHQTKNYSADFQLITKTGYIGEDWSLYSDQTALKEGFISAYSRKAPDEDFVELIAHYIITPRSAWNSQLEQAGVAGKAFIEQKLDVVRNYLKTAWRIDIEVLYNIVQERSSNFKRLDLKNL
ncbi:MAG: putative zinc-binding metallopeptidase [Prevotellaceae bacterium]|nr:putative zinc-binding metallopeptidase [Prevotellaceae bacterium]